MTDIKIVEHVVQELPSERPLVRGHKYKVMQSDGTLIEYVINSQGEPVRLKGITNDESSRLNRLSSDQISKVESITTGDISKLKEDYTKAEIDTKITDLGNLSTSSKVSLGNSTVLPVPPQSGGVTIPNAWVELAQNVTYTQAGGSSITGIEGHRSIAEWNGTSWSLVDMGALPVKQLTDTEYMLLEQYVQNGNPVFNEDGVLSSVSVLWSDEEPGVLNFLDYNFTFMSYDSYTVTYKTKTLTQPKVTRDNEGNIIIKPLKTIN